jgi:hypothetical protein
MTASGRLRIIAISLNSFVVLLVSVVVNEDSAGNLP